MPSINSVETEDEYIHVRFTDPDEYAVIRTPDWAVEVAGSVSDGALVRTGKRTGRDDWEPQSILIDKHVGNEKAREQAQRDLSKNRIVVIAFGISSRLGPNPRCSEKGKICGKRGNSPSHDWDGRNHADDEE